MVEALDITYWSERAEENFDDSERNSKSDPIAFMKLEADLKQAIASAIATYSGADIPPATLVALMETALGNPGFESVRFELQTALDALKDTSGTGPVNRSLLLISFAKTFWVKDI